MKSIKNTETRCAHLRIHTYRITHFFMVVLGSFSYGYASCPEVTVAANIFPSGFQVQTVQSPAQFIDMRVECNLDANQFCATTLNVTDSTVVLDTTTAGEYINLNDYNFLRSNRPIFPTFDNELILTSTITNLSSRFGTAVAISGDGSILAIGSSNYSTLQRVSMYRREGNTWTIQQIIVPPPPNTLVKSFGAVISLSWDGSILAVGVPSVPSLFFSAPLPPTPAVFMYELNPVTNQYELVQTILGNKFSGFASALQLSATGQYLVVTDDYNRLTPPSGDTINPSILVYTRTIICTGNCKNQGKWELQAQLPVIDASGNLIRSPIISSISNAYQYVAISGDGTTIALGWPTVAITVSPSLISAVAVFKRTGTVWRQVQYISHDEVNFGMSVSLSSDGSYLAVGKKGIDAGVDPHFVYVFALRGTQYAQETVLTIPEVSFENNANAPKVSLSADGTVLAIGTGGIPTSSFVQPSSVAIALRGPNNTWSMPFLLSPPGSTSIGASIACSADGVFIIAGAPGTNSSRGAAHIYRPVGSFIPNDTVVTGSLCVYRRTTMNSTLQVAGNIHLNGTIVTGTAGQVTACTATLSDKRVKNNITTLTAEDAHTKLHALQPVGFDWNAAYKNAAERRVGFIAQHIEKIFPHWVSTMPALSEHTPLIDDGNIKMIAIKPELYAYLVAVLERLIKKNNERNEEFLTSSTTP